MAVPPPLLDGPVLAVGARTLLLLLLLVAAATTPGAGAESYNRPYKNATLSLTLSGPEDFVAVRGQPARFSCVPKSSAQSTTAAIQWQFEGRPIAPNDPRFVVDANGTLTVPRVSGRRFEGAYRCWLRNDFGAILSSPARLRIATLGKEFQEEMANLTVPEGQPVVLPCRINSFPKASVDWVRDKLLLPQITRYVPLPTGSLLITNTHSSDTDTYSCNVTNPILKNKPKQSRKGQLTVTKPIAEPTPPKILNLKIDSNQTVLWGKNLDLFCAATGWPSPMIEWYKGSRLLASNATVLSLRNVTADDAGDYSCFARNRYGSGNQTFAVNVHQKPYFNHTLQSLTFKSPVTLRMPCHPFGIPRPRVYWLVNGTEFNFTADRRYFNNSQLSIFKSLTSDAGIYQCVAENEVGTAWIAAQYYSWSSPGSTLPAPINMRCQPYNDTGICVRWDVPPNVKPNAFTVDSYYGEMGPEYLSNVTYILASGLLPDKEYSFVSRLYNKSASDNSSAVTCRTGVIGKRNLSVHLYNSNSVNLTWSSISSDFPCDLSAVKYRIQYRHLHSNYSYIRYITKKNSTLINNLILGNTYEFRVASVTTKLAYCDWVRFDIPPSDKIITNNQNEFISDLFVKSRRSNSIQLKWNVSPTNQSRLDMFQVCCFEAYSEKSCDSIEGIRVETTRNDNVTLKGLKSSTVYEFSVRGMLEDGTSTHAKIVESSTLTEGPVIVYDLKYRIVNSTTVCVRWRAPYHKNGKYIKYTVRYSSQDGTQNAINVTASLAKNKTPCWIDQSGTDQMSVLLVQLNPDDSYKLFIEPEQNSDVLAAPPIYLSTNQKHSTEKIGSAKEDVEYDQKLGIALGMSISLCAFLACAIFLIRMVVKRRKVRTANRTNRTRFYVCEMRAQTNQIGATEVQEMQNLLVAGNGSGHVPAVPSADLDSKGSSDFPNKFTNGSAVRFPKKPNSTTNGHIHILENPQCGHFDRILPSSNGHANGLKAYEEDSNSNLPDADLQSKIFAHFTVNRNSKTVSTESLNVTQLTYLDDSEIMQTSLRKVSSPLGPNG